MEARALVKSYAMGGEIVRALDGVDLDIAQGELCAIIGQSGSGKSTLMNLLGCLDSPTSGSYRLAGIPVDELADDCPSSLPHPVAATTTARTAVRPRAWRRPTAPPRRARTS